MGVEKDVTVELLVRPGWWQACPRPSGAGPPHQGLPALQMAWVLQGTELFRAASMSWLLIQGERTCPRARIQGRIGTAAACA